MTLRVGLIGLGEVAQQMHLPLLADDPRFEIAAVSDLSPGLTERIGHTYRASRHTTDPEEIFAAPDLDAVFILTPDHLHRAQLERGIASGKHIFVEKPACLTAAELRPLLQQEPRGIVFVGYMRRYARAFMALRAQMPPVNEIRHVRIRDLICEAPHFVAQTRPTMRADDLSPEIGADAARAAEALVRTVVGPGASVDEVRAYRVLTGLSSHSLSTMRDLLGTPRAVASAHQRGGLTVTATFDYGAFLCSYEACITDIPDFDAGIDILTDTVRYRLTTDTPYIRSLPTTLTVTSLTPAGAHTEIQGPYYEDAFRSELNSFHGAVTEGGEVRTTLADALCDLDLIEDTARTIVGVMPARSW